MITSLPGTSNPNYKHGGKVFYKLEYNSWRAMRERCYDTNNAHYSLYGGRGIIVCNRWIEPEGNGFSNFLEDMGRRPSKGHSLDRIDNDGNYTPYNCRWATQKEQVNNSRTVKIYTINGFTGNVTDHIDRTGYITTLILNDPQAFGYLTPLVNILIVTAKQALTSEQAN